MVGWLWHADAAAVMPYLGACSILQIHRCPLLFSLASPLPLPPSFLLCSSNMENLNDRPYLEVVQRELLKVLSDVEAAPGVQISTGATTSSNGGIAIPPDMRADADGDDVKFPDRRVKDEGVLCALCALLEPCMSACSLIGG